MTTIVLRFNLWEVKNSWGCGTASGDGVIDWGQPLMKLRQLKDNVGHLQIRLESPLIPQVIKRSVWSVAVAQPIPSFENEDHMLSFEQAV